MPWIGKPMQEKFNVLLDLPRTWDAASVLKIVHGNFVIGAHDSVVGCDTMLQAGRSRVRFPMRSLDFSINLWDCVYHRCCLCRWVKRQRIHLLYEFLFYSYLYRTYEQTLAWRFAGCWLEKISLLLGSLCVSSSLSVDIHSVHVSARLK
jgi:hypothetical protein